MGFPGRTRFPRLSPRPRFPFPVAAMRIGTDSAAVLMYTVYNHALLSTQPGRRGAIAPRGAASHDPAKEDVMPLSDLLLYIIVFAAAFAFGCAHGVKSDIADQRKAIS